MGVRQAPPRSTLAYANAQRPAVLFERVFYALLAKFEHLGGGWPAPRKFRFKAKLLSLDATVIELCLGLFPWAKFRPTKGAVKLHLLLDHEGYFPVFARLTEGAVHELTVARQLRLPAASIVAFDRGYNDYRLFAAWTAQRVWFVTRQKAAAVYTVLERRVLPEHRNIRADEIIQVQVGHGPAARALTLRRVVVWNAAKQEELVLLTNHLQFGPTTIAAIYRDRWQIEIFFKELKQHLKLKTFVGTSPNALKTQIWTALIAMLLLKYLKFRAQAGLSLANLVALLRWNLFTYRELTAWLADPYAAPPPEPDPPGPPGPVQLEFTFGTASGRTELAT